MTKYKKPLTTKEIAKLKDKDIDYSDIDELDADFWDSAEIVYPEPKQPITLRVKQSVLQHFKRDGKGYQTRMNAVLESYVLAQKAKDHNEQNTPQS